MSVITPPLINPTATLVAAGWKLMPDGQWRSPLTQRDFTEREAIAVDSIKPRSRNLIYRPRKFARR